MFTQGKRFNHPLVRIVICDCKSEGDPARVAFAAAKRLGNAVVRNRSKRVLRETARACELPVSGKEIILFATPKTRSASPTEMSAALCGLLRRAGVDTPTLGDVAVSSHSNSKKRPHTPKYASVSSGNFVTNTTQF